MVSTQMHLSKALFALENDVHNGKIDDAIRLFSMPYLRHPLDRAIIAHHCASLYYVEHSKAAKTLHEQQQEEIIKVRRAVCFISIR